MTAKHEYLSGPRTARPVACFSPGVKVGQLVQVAGQSPLDPDTGAVLVPNDVAAQTRIVLEKVTEILDAGGASLSDVVMMRVYLSAARDFAEMNKAYDEFMIRHLGEHAVMPPRTTVAVGLALEGMTIEIDALAVAHT